MEVRDFSSRLQRLASTLRRRHSLSRFDLSHDRRSDAIELADVEVPRHLRKQGVGSRVMGILTKFADKHKKRIWLHTGEKNSLSGTTSRGRLVKFYRVHGFVPNKGKRKDYALSRFASMYRNPK